MKSLSIFVLCITLLSCNDSSGDDQKVCTEEFRTVAITVSGATLDDFYTIRKSNQETIRYSSDEVIENSYPVLTDEYQPMLKNKEETFQFIGIIENQTVVDEDFIIKADECHIQYVSGKTEVTIDS